MERNRDLVGQTAEVLVEGAGRKGGTQGRTRTNKVVNVRGRHAPGTFLDVRISKAHPHHLDGEVERVSSLFQTRAEAVRAAAVGG